jgi:soluble lytic murein transglycosylase-like protein
VTQQDLIAIARQEAEAAGLDAALICGICERESSWNPWAIRYEPLFFSKYVAPLFANNKIEPPNMTEAMTRAVSWGLLQTMGQSVREIGYTGPLPQLCDPTTGLEWGIKLFQLKLQHAEGNTLTALLLWNGGSNPAYPDDVLNLAMKYRS